MSQSEGYNMAHKTRGEQRAANDKKAVTAMFSGMLDAALGKPREVPNDFRHKKTSWLIGYDTTQDNKVDDWR